MTANLHHDGGYGRAYDGVPTDAAVWLRTLLLAVLALWTTGAWAAPYDPMAVSAAPAPAVLDRTVHDRRRDRNIPVRVYLPVGTRPVPVVLFSPGLGGSRTGYAYLARHWAARGYAVVVLQHPGSDDTIWKGKSPERAVAAMRRAASGRNFLLRVKDVPAVLNRLAIWNRTDGDPLAGRLNLAEIGMAGHSFGAVTTEAVSGERFRGRALFTDPRIKAALALSPSSPRRQSPSAAFGEVSLPWMLMTGTRDIGLLGLGARDVASRLAVYDALPPGNKYELVLAGAQHSAFSDRPLPPGDAPRNPNDHRAIEALSTAFWDAMLRHAPAAAAWLDGAGPKTVLKPGDRWRRK